jgi:membrane-associated progesterone receptor component
LCRYTAAASPGMSVTLTELATYNGTSSGKPMLLSILGRVYDVGAGKAHYGVGGQYHAFAGKDISVVGLGHCSGNFAVKTHS